MSEETKRRISISHLGNKNPSWKGGKPTCRLCEKKLSTHKAILCLECYRKNCYGENASNWRNGGKSKLNHRIKTSFKYRQWRSDVFTRDNFICQECLDRGGVLHAHHIKKKSKILIENNIESYKEAMNCEELWNINNGQTLCYDCHKKTNSYGTVKSIEEFATKPLEENQQKTTERPSTEKTPA